MIKLEKKINCIFAYITKLNLMKNLSKRAKLIILLVSINILGYGVAVTYFAKTVNTNQSTLILTGVKQDQYYMPNTSTKLVDYCITLMKLIKRN